MKIKNINTDLIKKNSLKLCLGVSMVGVLTAGVSFSKNFIQHNYNKALQRIENEEYQNNSSTITCNYAHNYKYNNYDDLIIITSHAPGDKYNTVNASLDLGYTSTKLQPGQYQVISHLGSIDMTIDEANEEYSITIDYVNNIFECEKVKKEDHHVK